MAYNETSIVNMALMRAGAKGQITALTDLTEVARKVSVFYEYIRDEVLEDIKPKFAVTRVALAQNATAPVNGYDYAYTLPADYLCRVQDRPDKPSVSAVGYPYEIERNSAGTLCLFTDYDNTGEDLYLTYVKRLTDPALYTASFINAFTDRLAAEMSLSITDSGRFSGLMQKYEATKRAAKAATLAEDYLEDETGSDNWETAGR